ncbi:uncharacterized protein LOC134277814 [Saccostrea cucullata]|uniref:uncharacterized protein LOC134277814 n=1 Tax=Saccostrea cuccullata TaxID=36930 RepID=UPI002ED0F22C
MEELKVCLSTNIKIEEREEKGEVCNVTYFETGQKDTLDYSVIKYSFEFRYLGRTKLVEHKVWDGFSQFRTLKPDNCKSNESHLSSVFRLEIEGIIQKKEYLGQKRLLTLKVEVIVTSKFSRHLLPKQLMPYEFLTKNGEKNENTSEKSCKAAESYEDFPFFHHKLIWLVLQFLIAVIVKIIIGYFSLMTHSMLHALVPIVLMVSRSYGELCIPEATLEVGNITPLKPCETCDFHKLNCQGNNISACLKIFPTTQFAVGCAPNICINDGCPEWNGGNGSYKIQYRNGECNSTCQGHLSLAEWIKNCTISQPPSIGDSCFITTTGENGSDNGAIMIASFSVVAVGVVVIVVLVILWKKNALCFKNIGHSKKNEPEGERLRDI